MSQADAGQTDKIPPGTGQADQPTPGSGQRPADQETSLERRPPGHPHPVALVRDGLLSAIAQPVATLTAAVVVAIVCVVVFATTGQVAANEAAVLGQIDSVGTRMVVAVDSEGRAQLSADAVAAAEALDVVDWAFGLGAVSDVANANLANISGKAGLRPFYGQLPPDVALVAGRLPGPGEAVVGTQAAGTLRLADGWGAVTDGVDEVSVVGQFEATGPLASLDTLVLVATSPTDGETIRYLYAMARDVGAVPVVSDVLARALPAEEPTLVEIDEPTGAVALQQVIAGQLGSHARTLMAVVLAIGLVVIAVTMLGAVSARRRDFGRRRALGATRTAIVVMVLIQTSVAACVGAVAGGLAGVVVVHQTTGGVPTALFTAGVCLLAVLTALLGAVPPAVAAANRDPLRILRVP